MIRTILPPITFAAMLIAIFSGCSRKNETADISISDTIITPIHNEKNAAYFWKTVFTLNDAELKFLKRHNVERIYLRMFDVVTDPFADNEAEKTVPNASVRIDNATYNMLTSSMSDMEFVPVVYITLDALKAMSESEDILASNIVTRVKNMSHYNGLPNVSEIQLDCDWTKSTEQSYFNLCDSVRKYILEDSLGWDLSSTVRLHQLSGRVPPVDRGVLMVYNTGSFDNPDADNSIIDYKDVEPYLKRLPSYPLHLDVAYPTYSWQLLFRGRKFAGLLNGVDLSDTSRFEQSGSNRYKALCDFPIKNRLIRQGDIIRQEKSEAQDILRTKDMIEKCLNGKIHSNIIYHLDSLNLSTYKFNEIETLFRTDD